MILLELNDPDQAKEVLLAGISRDAVPSQNRTSFPGPAMPFSTPAPLPRPRPAIWNVPHPRNPNFTGREDLLTSLHDALNQEGASVLTQTLHGLGGVGKTQTALEYAYRYAFEYDLVWWLGSEEPTKLAADYASLAAKLNLPEKDLPDQPAVIAAVKDWLRLHPNWLLVFDNAREPDQIKPYLPGGNGHVLVTSRNPNWGALAGDPAGAAPAPGPGRGTFSSSAPARTDADAAGKLCPMNWATSPWPWSRPGPTSPLPGT